MRKSIGLFLLFFVLSVVNCSSKVNDPKDGKAADSTAIDGWKLVWSDEFNYTGLPDSTKWGYDVGDNGWGNHEKEYYTEKRKENARVENGKLIIEARRDFYNVNGEQKEFTSARIFTAHKGDWTYGRFEVRAKLPYGKGTWPAIWMLPTEWTLGNGSWPDNGEIDIMEHVGYDQGVIHGSTHCNKYVFKKGTQKTATIKIPDCATAFHTYTAEWDKDKITMFVDDSLYFTSTNEGSGWQGWPFFKDFHFILNIAVGGDWGGVEGVDNNIFPQKMEVEYVRVYQRP